MKALIKRVATTALYGFVIVFFVVCVTFVLYKIMPGDPLYDIALELQRSRGLPSFEDAYELAKQIAMFYPSGDPLDELLKYLRSFFTGNWGISTFVVFGMSVTRLIFRALPWTLFIISTSTTISFLLGIFIGRELAYRRGKKAEVATTIFTIIWQAIPDYFVAVALIIVFGYQLKILPPAGNYGPEGEIALRSGNLLGYYLDILKHSILPIFTFVINAFGGWALAMRAACIRVLESDHVVYAKSRGVTPRRITSAYIGRIAMLPIFTSFVISLARSIGGSTFIENLFRYPGVGLLLARASGSRDIYLLCGVLNMLTIATVTGNILADFVYGLLDPRIRRR